MSNVQAYHGENIISSNVTCSRHDRPQHCSFDVTHQNVTCSRHDRPEHCSFDVTHQNVTCSRHDRPAHCSFDDILMSNVKWAMLRPIMARTSYIRWDDNNVRIRLDQHVKSKWVVFIKLVWPWIAMVVKSLPTISQMRRFMSLNCTRVRQRA
jgi:hypothetical protein